MDPALTIALTASAPMTLARSRRYGYAPVAGGTGWNVWLPVKECRAMEFSAAERGGRPKLCPVGESRFKEVMKSPKVAQFSIWTAAPSLVSANRSCVFVL